MPKLFESQKPLFPPPASAGSLGGVVDLGEGAVHVKCPPKRGKPGVSLPVSPRPRYTPPPRPGTRVCLPGMGHSDGAHCSRVSGWDRPVCGFPHPGLEGAPLGGRIRGPLSALQHRPQQAVKGNAGKGRREPALQDPLWGTCHFRLPVLCPRVRSPE